MKRFDTEHAEIEVGIEFQKFAERAAGNVSAARERDVWMPRTQVGIEANGERRFLNTFVELKEMRVASADTDPNNFHLTLRWKRADTLDRKEKGAKLNRA